MREDRLNQPRRPVLGLLAVAVVAVGSLPAACGTWLKNPKKPAATATLSLHLVGKVGSAPPPQAAIAVTDAAGLPSGSFAVTAAAMVLKEISLKAGGADEQIGGSVPGPYVFDLLKGSITPEIPDVPVAPGAYDAIEMTLSALPVNDPLAASLPPALARSSLFLAGDLTGADGRHRHLELALDLDDEFTLPRDPAADTVSIRQGDSTSIVVTFALDQWFHGASAGLNAIPDDAVVLGPAVTGQAKEVRDLIRKNIEQAASFRRDDNS